MYDKNLKYSQLSVPVMSHAACNGPGGTPVGSLPVSVKPKSREFSFISN